MLAGHTSRNLQRTACDFSDVNAIELSLFSSRLSALCDEMGAVLCRTALSTNIRDRLDYSCAVFDSGGALCAQAAHIPVHLGSMAFAMRSLVAAFDWQDGDMVIVNDPFAGGTHLPDITLIAPVFAAGECIAFVANRAHHADIGAHSPGSMPVSSRLEEEGLVLEPQRLVQAGRLDTALLQRIAGATAAPAQMYADLAAQRSANRAGVRALETLLQDSGVPAFRTGLDAVNAYGERLSAEALERIPDGSYACTDYMDDDGQGQQDIAIHVCLEVRAGRIHVDFAGTAAQVPGNINCPLSVTAAAVWYVFRCLMPAHTPACAGSFRAIALQAPEGSLVNALRPAAVAAGNVETSSRIVDVVAGALAQALPELMPAASQGTMNNLAMGARSHEQNWDYYETIGGGCGAGPTADGRSAVQSHMTNTLNTPIEVLEQNFPLRIERYQIRRGSGGAGRYRGGDGLVREYRFLAPARVTLLTERRRRPPWGLRGGAAAACGENRLNGVELLPKIAFSTVAGDCLTICTPGGGGWGKKADKRSNG